MRTSSRKRSRIGVYGGTFDPLHTGHLVIAEAARTQLRLSKILFVPAARAPHKKGRSATSPVHRLGMLRLALKPYPEFVPSDLEIRRGGISYSVDTIRQVRKQFPKAEVWLIIGSDNLRDLSRWKEPVEILKQARIAVYERPGYLISVKVLRRTNAVVLEGGMLDISATVIRQIEARSGSIRFLVPSSVERYIRRHRLYRRLGKRHRP